MSSEICYLCGASNCKDTITCGHPGLQYSVILCPKHVRQICDLIVNKLAELKAWDLTGYSSMNYKTKRRKI